ncbi:MAG: hypothetical protein ACK5JJ_14330 [Cyanobacteriota bacterium]|jgi:hypothetical protein
MTFPVTQNWQAFENRQPPVTDNSVPLLVTGEVETAYAALQPVLRRAIPQGINPNILLLSLSVEQIDDLEPARSTAFREVRFDDTVSLGQFTQVDIISATGFVQSINVQVTN